MMKFFVATIRKIPSFIMILVTTLVPHWKYGNLSYFVFKNCIVIFTWSQLPLFYHFVVHNSISWFNIILILCFLYIRSTLISVIGYIKYLNLLNSNAKVTDWKFKYWIQALFGYSTLTHDLKNRGNLSTVDTINFGIKRLSIAYLASKIYLISWHQFRMEIHAWVITLSVTKKVIS